MRIVILIAIIGTLFSCNKNKKNTTVVNGKVNNAVTGEPMSNIEVRLIEDIAGFPFTAATTVVTTRTDENGNFYFERNTKENLGVAISSNNEFISTAVVYDEIKTYETNIELGKVNNVTLTPAEYGFLNAQIISDGNADSLSLKESYHLILNPNGYTPSYVTLYDGYQSTSSGEKITGKYIVEYYKYFSGNGIYQKDTIEIFKGQTTNYELHF